MDYNLVHRLHTNRKNKMYIKLALSIILVFIFGSSIPDAESLTAGMIMLSLFVLSVMFALSYITQINESSK